MKSCRRYCAIAVMLVFATPAMTTHAAMRTTGTANVTTSADDLYPYQLPLTFEITHGDGHELSSVTELMITVRRSGEEDETTILSPVNPFNPQNGCTRPMPEGLAACVVSGDHSIGTLRVNWQVPKPGSYRIVVSAKRGGRERETLVEFALDTVA